MAEGDIDNRVSRGPGLSYVFHKNLLNDDQELVDFCDEESLKVVRTLRRMDRKIVELRCTVWGCSKKFRLISYVDPIPSLLEGQFVIEEVLNEEHDHVVEGMPLRGLSREQKGIVLFCEERRIGAPKRVLAEFHRRGNVNIVANVAVIPTPTTALISSFLSYHRKKMRGNMGVGKATLYDIEAYSLSKKFGKT